MLVLSGKGLVFFTATCIMLCFGFMMKTVSVTSDCFVVAKQCLHRVKVFSDFHAALLMQSFGWHKKLGGHAARISYLN